jgi:glutamate dehydrogenase (NAD(P)+)
MATRRVVTGKSILNGGSAGRDKATGQGLVYSLEAWAQRHGADVSKYTFMVQGFGNVGSHASMLLHDKGARLAAVNDHSGSIANPEGIDARDLAAWVGERGAVEGYPKASRVDLEHFYATDADLFIPAALECTIDDDTAPLLRVDIVAEGANGPTTLSAEKGLLERGVHILPDILANSGGVTVSYFEWIQNKNSEVWELGEVDDRLRTLMRRATFAVLDEAEARGCDLRTAALTLALGRLEKVYKERGIFP